MELLTTGSRYALGPWEPCDLGYGGSGSGSGSGASCLAGACCGAGALPRAIDPAQPVCKRARFTRDSEKGWVTLKNPTTEFCGRLEESVVVPLLRAAGLTIAGMDAPVEHQELLSYGVGGHFKTHCDRHLGPGHVGTLLMIVPEPGLEGGVLVAPARDLHSEDLHSQISADPDLLTVVFIPLGVPHAVTKVTAGGRLVAKAAVFGSPLDPGAKEPALRIRED